MITANINTIIMVVVTGCMGAVLPEILDLFVGTRIVIMNQIKGYPTWRIGRKFPKFLFDGAYMLHNVEIIGSNLKYLKMRDVDGHTFDIAKRNMKKHLPFSSPEDSI
ncbi:MAG: hypothetical protein GY804_08560 [Alphaproteobacteria bacterium]|nr:hypothetical protein [Alphaproteobacteria bacterium]